MSEPTTTTTELRHALSAALADLGQGETAAAPLIMEVFDELVLQYEFAVAGLRQAREKIAALEADAAALREWTIKYRNARDLMLRDPEQFSDQECLQIIREKQQADQKIAELLQAETAVGHMLTCEACGRPTPMKSNGIGMCCWGKE